jgi:hypothetical protein
MRRKLLIIKPNGAFSTIYTEGRLTLRNLGHCFHLEDAETNWAFPVDVTVQVVELQGREG